jgi:hypothetical protein
VSLIADESKRPQVGTVEPEVERGEDSENSKLDNGSGRIGVTANTTS